MKKLFYLAIILLGVGMVSSCTKEGGASTLVGTWDLVETGYVSNGTYISSPILSPAYWVFTESTFTAHDSTDMMNGVGVDYEYSDGCIKIFGMQFFKVELLTKSTLKVNQNLTNGDGAHTVMTFKRR